MVARRLELLLTWCIPAILRQNGRAAARRKDWITAARIYERLVHRPWPWTNDIVQWAHALKESGDEDRALQAYWKAALRAPAHVEAQKQLIANLRRSGQTGAALGTYGRALAAGVPQAELERDAGDLARSANLLDSAMLVGPFQADADRRPNAATRLASAGLRALARITTALGAMNAGDRIIDFQARVVPTARALREAGDRQAQRGNMALAVERYRRGLVMNAHDIDGLIGLAAALDAAGNTSAALQAYQAAWRLRPWWPATQAALRQRGWSTAQMEQLTARSWSALEFSAVSGDMIGWRPASPSQIPTGLSRAERDSLYRIIARLH